MSEDYQIFQVTCADCGVVYDVRTFYKGQPMDYLPCSPDFEFEETKSHGYCPDNYNGCHTKMLEKIRIKRSELEKKVSEK